MSPEGMDMQHSPGDPFIGSGPAGSNFSTSSDGSSSRGHTKQESADSGLGGMGNTFSLARGPGEEFMEESMDDGEFDKQPPSSCHRANEYLLDVQSHPLYTTMVQEPCPLFNV